MVKNSCLSRRDFLRLVPTTLLGFSEHSLAQEHTQNSSKLEEMARREANNFISSIPNDLSTVGKVKLSYDVYMQCKYSIILKAKTTLLMGKDMDKYQATVGISEPEPQTEWSWLIMNLIGKNTNEYKKMVRAIKLKISETFHLDNIFKTNVFKQEISSDDSEQKTLKVEFNYQSKHARLWKDNGEDSLTIPLDSQTGPMTGYFNLIFFPKTAMEMTVIKPQKRYRGKKVDYVFKNDIVRFVKDNGTYKFLFEKGSLFDRIEGGVVFDAIESNRSLLPHTIRIDSMISLKLKENRDRRLRRLEMIDPKPLSYEEMRNDILNEDIYAAKDIRAYLAEAHIR